MEAATAQTEEPRPQAGAPHAHDHGHPHRARRLVPGALMLTGLIAPVAFVGLAFSAGDADHGGYVCPLREATGIPCPACGATRAFFHLANLDTGFLHYNWAWPVMWLGFIGWAVLLLVRGWRGEPLRGPRVWGAWRGLEGMSLPWVIATPFILLGPAWIVALTNIHYIRNV
jgi:hypothetical protein